jgi:hypothetical protein
MKWKLLAILVLVLAQPAVAWADGPSGSKEDAKGQVKCGDGTATPLGTVYGGANGVEVCNEGNDSPDGRIIISFAGQFIAIDGDPTNSQFMGTGFVRADASGVSCGNAQKTDSTSGAGGTCP